MLFGIGPTKKATMKRWPERSNLETVMEAVQERCWFGARVGVGVFLFLLIRRLELRLWLDEGEDRFLRLLPPLEPGPYMVLMIPVTLLANSVGLCVQSMISG